MRDTSTLFKLCVKALLELSADDVRLLMQLAGVLHPDVPTDEHNPTAIELRGQAAYEFRKAAVNLQSARTVHQRELDRQTKEIGKQAAKRTRAKNMRKRKAKAKDFDPAKALAAHANKTHTPHGNETSGPKGMSVDVLNILRQSTGALSPIEIAELLNLKPGRVSAVLCHLWLHKKYKGLTRVAGKNDGRAVYLYALNEASK